MREPVSGGPGRVLPRARIRSFYREEKEFKVRIAFGVEAFFAPKKKALELEKDLRQGGVAVLMVSANGKTVLKKAVAELK